MVQGRAAEAAAATDEALTLAPHVVELRFWAALNHFQAGNEAYGLRLFRETFAAERVWATLLPRLVPAGLLPDDPELVARILAEVGTAEGESGTGGEGES